MVPVLVETLASQPRSAAMEAHCADLVQALNLRRGNVSLWRAVSPAARELFAPAVQRLAFRHSSSKEVTALSPSPLSHTVIDPLAQTSTGHWLGLHFISAIECSLPCLFATEERVDESHCKLSKVLSAADLAWNVLLQA